MKKSDVGLLSSRPRVRLTPGTPIESTGYLLFAGIPFVVSEVFSAFVTHLSPTRKNSESFSALFAGGAPAPLSPLSPHFTTDRRLFSGLVFSAGWRFLFFGGNAAVEMRRRAPSSIPSPEKQLKVSWPQPMVTGPSMGGLPRGGMASSWGAGFFGFLSWDFGTEPFDTPSLEVAA